MPSQKDIGRVRGLEKHLGLRPGECERSYGEDDTITRLSIPVEMVEELWDLRTLTTILLKKLDVALPVLDGVIGFQSLRSGVQAYHGPALNEEMEALRALLNLPKPAAHPREFYPEGYCKTCDGEGKVPGGEGLPDRTTKMNMQRFVTAVKDEDAARKLLLARNESDVDGLLSNLPFNLERVGSRGVPSVNAQTREQSTVTLENPPSKDADLSMFEIEIRRWDWDRPSEKRWKDICADCKGDGGRGLPKFDYPDDEPQE